jgi:hypothetical protein
MQPAAGWLEATGAGVAGSERSSLCPASGHLKTAAVKHSTTYRSTVVSAFSNMKWKGMQPVSQRLLVWQEM